MYKRIVAVIMCVILTSLCGCGWEEPSIGGKIIVDEESTEEQGIEGQESPEEDYAEEDSSDIYQRFLDGKEPVYFREADLFEGYALSLSVETETPYGLRDICEIINTVKNGNISLEEFSEHISYANIDCGADGKPELAVKFYHLTDTISDEVTLIIKDVDGRLEVCYIMKPFYKETWELANVYGMVSYHVAAGTGVDGNFEGYIDADGIHHVVWDEFNDYNFYYVYNFSENIPYEVPDDEMIVLKTFTFEMGTPGQDPDLKQYPDLMQYDVLASLDLTMPGDNYNTENSTVDIDGLSRAVAEETGREFYSLEDIRAMIEAREAELGLTDEIKNGPMVEWLPFTGTIATF